MRLEQIAIASIVFGLIIILGFKLYGEQVNSYGLPDDGIVMGENFKTMSGVEDLSSLQTTEDVIKDAEVSNDNSDASVAKAAIPGGKTITNYKGDVGKQIQAVTNILKLPPEITTAALWIISVLCTAYIIYLLRGYNPPKD